MQEKEVIAVFKTDGNFVTSSIQPCKYREEIVRCKDCKHRYVTGTTTMYYVCGYLEAENKDDGFCSYGERREP